MSPILEITSSSACYGKQKRKNRIDSPPTFHICWFSTPREYTEALRAYLLAPALIRHLVFDRVPLRRSSRGDMVSSIIEIWARRQPSRSELWKHKKRHTRIWRIVRLGFQVYEPDLAICDRSGSSRPLSRFEEELQERYRFFYCYIASLLLIEVLRFLCYKLTPNFYGTFYRHTELGRMVVSYALIYEILEPPLE